MELYKRVMVVVQQLSVVEATDVPFFPCFESVCILECKLVAKNSFINGIVTLCVEKHGDLDGGTRGGASQRVNVGIDR